VRESGRGHAAAIWKQLAAVIEEDDAVAQQAPTLFGVDNDRDSGGTVEAVGRRAGWLVLAGARHEVLAG
jgi:hypothetical protein